MNKELYGKYYQIPPTVLQQINAAIIKHPTGNGIKRAKYLLKNKRISYEGLKRLKNFFDYYNSQKNEKSQFELAGGKLMRNFVNLVLDSERNVVKISKEIKQNVGYNPKTAMKPSNAQVPILNEEENKELTKNAVAVIVNNDNRILLLKRGPNAPWQPNKWSLVGGGVENGETSKEAVLREIKEETELDVEILKEAFAIQRKPDSIEDIFLAKYDGNDYDVKLDDENVAYGWYAPEEIKFLDTVPNLMDYINLVFVKYD